MRNFSLLAVLAVPALAGCSFHFSSSPSCWVTERDAFEVERGTFTAVSCTTHNGAVTVAAADEGDKVLVRVKKSAGANSEADAREAMDNLEVTHRRVEGKLVLGWRWIRRPDHAWRADVAFDISQPRDLPIEVETHNGEVRTTGFAAAVTARSHNGDLHLLDCAGKLTAETHNGEIQARVAARELNLLSHNGSVEVALRGDGPVRGSVVTHNGPVRLELEGAPTGRLVCRTHNGRVKCERELANVESGRSFLVGDLGVGDGRLEVETHNGSIRVN